MFRLGRRSLLLAIGSTAILTSVGLLPPLISPSNAQGMTMFYLGKRSLSRLEGVHPDLVRVVKRAIRSTVCDFTVLEGVRAKARHLKLFQAGASKVMDSRHIPVPEEEGGNGLAHAVDLGAYLDGEVRWDWPLYYQIAAAMLMAAVQEGVTIRWGGDWDSDGDYTDEKWRDGPHFELPRKLYPA